MRRIPSSQNYFVTKSGHIYSTMRGKLRRLKPKSHSSGYYQVMLVINGIKTYRYIHRLVLETWTGKCPEGHQCDHKNGNKKDNRLVNLHWVTRKQNMQLIAEQKGKNWNKGSNHPHARFTEKDILKIRQLYAEGMKQQEIAELFGVRQNYISLIVNYKIWKHVCIQSGKS